MNITNMKNSAFEVNVMGKNRILKLIKRPQHLFLVLGRRGFFKWMSDKTYLKIAFKCEMGNNLNLENPVSFNEKLQWLKLNNRKSEYTKMVDKYAVRKYISDTIGQEYLIPLLGVWDSAKDIDFDMLPNQFVLKCTHDSGRVIICKDKSTFDFDNAKQKLSKWLNQNYFWGDREWVYKDVKPRIIAEKYMTENSSDELKDYKFMCFNGQPKFLLVCSNRFNTNGLNIDFYDLNWDKLSLKRKNKENSIVPLSKPKLFDLMIVLSKKLSSNIPFVRIDFYEINGRVFFGEITFFPSSGMEEFVPKEWDMILGKWLMLPSECGENCI